MKMSTFFYVLSDISIFYFIKLDNLGHLITVIYKGSLSLIKIFYSDFRLNLFFLLGLSFGSLLV